jgi:uncharacterized membrane protein YccC
MLGGLRYSLARMLSSDSNVSSKSVGCLTVSPNLSISGRIFVPGPIVVTRIRRLRAVFRAFVRLRRVQLAHSIRVTIAALAALALAQLLHLPLPLWAVLTAVIVTQMSVGRSLKATLDYLVGTLGGAIYGGAIAVLIPHSNEIALLCRPPVKLRELKGLWLEY